MNKNIDIMDCQQFPNYDILYCDPPWEQRMVKFFETQLQKQTGIKKENQIEAILNKLATLSDKSKPLFIEYSIKGHDRVIDIMQENGHQFFHKMILPQSNGKPYIVMCFNTNVKLREELKGGEIVTYVVQKFKNPVVFDPFAGIGFTARYVFEAGGKYIGYELNPKRFERLELTCKKYENI